MLARVKERLGRPFYEREGVAIYNMDCVCGLEQLPPNLVHLTITSPPYNIGKEYERRLPLQGYLEWCGTWIRAVHRVTRHNGAFWLNLGYISVDGRAKALPIPYLLWDRIPFYLVQEIIWNYGAGVAGKRFFSPRNEKFLWYVKSSDDYTFNLDDVRDPDVKYPNQKKNGKKKCNPIGKNPSDVWLFPKVTSGENRSSIERTDHPAQFPQDVITRIVLASSNPGELLLDPFLGSGTTAVVAALLGRLAVGFEVKQEYCDLAARRIDAFFDEKEIARKQMSLTL